MKVLWTNTALRHLDEIYQFIAPSKWLVWLLIVVLQASTVASTRPNVIVILADDLGYGDTSLFDGWVKTPQIERLASEGLTFSDFHTNSSVCSPTRAAFLTGRCQQRVGIVDVITSHLDTPGLDPSEWTVSRLMKQNGPVRQMASGHGTGAESHPSRL
jgi:arylsulfatase A